MEAIDVPCTNNGDRHYLPASLSWTAMFRQLQQHHGSSRPLPARLVQWTSTQRRQYRMYGIGLKEPVGIIKHRVKKLNDLNFVWNPMEMMEDEESVQEERQRVVTKKQHRNKRRLSSNNEPREDSDRPKYTTTSSGRRVRRRGSYASYNTASDDEEEENVEAVPIEVPKKKKKAASSSSSPKEKHPTIPGITRSGTNKKWQVRTNHPITNERTYLGSYILHSDALNALNAYKKNTAQLEFVSNTTNVDNRHKQKSQHGKKKGKKWKVNLNHNGEQIYIGAYNSHEEAAEALRIAKRRYSKHNNDQHQQSQRVKNGKWGIKGICRLKNGKWEVRVPIPGVKKKRYLGMYSSEEEAVAALTEAMRLNRDDDSTRHGDDDDDTTESLKDGDDDDASPSREERLRIRLERRESREDDTDDNDDDDQEDAEAFKLSVGDVATPIKSNVSPATKQSVREKKERRSLFSSSSSSQKKSKGDHITGITQRPNGRWETRCYINGVRKYLGQYHSKEEAIQAMLDAGADDFSPEDREQLMQSLEEGNDGLNDNDEDTVNTAENDDGTVETSEKNEEDDDDTVNTNDDATSKTENDEDNLSKGDDSTVTDGSIDQPVQSPRAKFFPLILYQMVNESSEFTPEILEWLPCGSAFRINDHDAIGDLLGKYFRSSQYNSFHRMLNLYGFTKQSVGKYDGAFKHPQFHRDISTEDTILARVVRR